MKYRLTILILLFLPLFMRAQDSLSIDTALLEEYCKAIETAPDAERRNECDFIISSCNDASTRNQAALYLYNYFRNSKLMDSESVAIYVFDKWFATKKAEMPDELSLLSAEIWCDFNRKSLVGCTAPSFKVRNARNDIVALNPSMSGKASVLYFYSTDCAKCKVENIMLRNVLENRDCDINIYAVCTSSDRSAWEDTKNASLKFDVSNSYVYHYITADNDKDWQMLYGVLQTPRLFLIDVNGVIVGRGLDSIALDRMLAEMFAPAVMSYGSAESMQFYQDIFDAYKAEHGQLDAENIAAVANHIAVRTLEEARDTVLFKQMTGDLLYYLDGRSEKACRNSVSAFIDNQIYGRKDVWTNADDSLQILGMCAIVKELADRNLPGSTLPAVKVKGKYLSSGKMSREKSVRLDKLPSSVNRVFLYHPECGNCREEMEAAENLKGVKILCINLKEIEEADDDTLSALADGFDLSILPQILYTKGSTVIDKNCSFIE